MVNFPKIKKKVNAFLLGEEGKISKESLIKTGAILGIVALGTLKSVHAWHSSVGGKFDHINDMGFERTSAESVKGVHENELHAQAHTSHSSHSSHCSGLSCHWW